MKKKYSSAFFYIISIILFFVIIYGVQHLAHLNLEDTQKIIVNETTKPSYLIFIDNLIFELNSPLSILLIQLVVILISVKLFGYLCKKIGQPTVVGEIIAGIVLGPSIIGHYFPQFSLFLFPSTSLHYIEMLSEVGLILFMFIVGLELNLKDIKKKANEAILISHSSIILPFALGFVLAYFMYPHFIKASVPFISFALFMGISLSITAFPVLARIVHERGMNKTKLGSIVITCAAIDDITAWCILATVITIVKANSFTGSIFVIIVSIIYIVFMFKFVKPILRKLTAKLSSKKMMSRSMLILYFIILFLSAYTTEIIGIHALFGAFLAGVIMPTNFNFREKITLKIEDVTLIIFLPLFFVYTGLKTQIGLIDDLESWIYCFIIILVAIVGKFFGGALAAKYIGLDWKSSSIIGVLMNTRGLMELVVLNIGLELGVLSPKIFSMMVLMAIVTTFITSPLLSLIEKISKGNKVVTKKAEYNILIAFDDVYTGQKNLQFCSFIFKNLLHPINVTMLYVSEGNHLYQHESEEIEEQKILDDFRNEMNILNYNFNIVTKVSNNFSKSVVKYANNEDFQFILINDKNRSDEYMFFDLLYSNIQKIINLPYNLLGKFGQNKKLSNTISAPFDDSITTIISKTDASVGIFIENKQLPSVKKVFSFIMDEDDTFMGPILEKIAENTNIQFLVWDSIQLANESIELTASLKNIKNRNPYFYQEWNSNRLLDLDIVKQYDLIIVSLKGWKKIQRKIEDLRQDAPSVLVLTY